MRYTPRRYSCGVSSTIERIDLDYGSNPMRSLISLAAPPPAV